MGSCYGTRAVQTGRAGVRRSVLLVDVGAGGFAMQQSEQVSTNQEEGLASAKSRPRRFAP